jgi:trehalose 6-phosphate phosphatase
VDRIDLLADEPERAAVLLDVDGTLAPIVPRPEDARVPAATKEELARLVGRYALVACVSGRPGADAARVVGVEGIVAVGEHGLELEPEARKWAGRIARIADGAGRAAERKPLSAAFHFREDPDPEAALRELRAIEELARRQGLRTRWGRKVLELLPPVDASKETAVRRLLGERDLRRALYAGDDTTDLDAFRALDGLEVGIRVAVRSGEAPPGLLAAADVVVDGTDGMLELLRRL